MNIPHNNILDIIISLTLIYALLSVLVSILMEWWNHYRNTRGTMLKHAIYQLLSDPLNRQYGEIFHNHFLISGLKKKINRPPQYISSDMFAEALIDIIAKQAEEREVQQIGSNDEKKYETVGEVPPDKVIKKFEFAITKKMNSSPFNDVLLSFWDKSGGDYDKMKALIAKWYNDYMDRVTGWYKSKQRWKLIFFGFLVAVGLNVDSIHLLKVLSLDDNLRNSLEATAERVAEQYNALADSSKQNSSQLIKAISTAIPDSLKNDSLNQNKIQNIVQYLVKKDSSTYNTYVKRLLLNDSVSVMYFNRADSIIGIAASMNLPIGWNSQTAPLSWKLKDLFCCKCIKKECSKQKSAGLIAYNNHRNNCTSWVNVLKYLLGILITSISLGFGAPFWFDLLIKLVNLRQAGKKPNNKKVK